MDSTFTQNKIHGLFKPSVTAILLETGKQEEVFMDTLCISWNTNCMKKQNMRSVVLSTIEAEYIALSEVVKEIKFIIQLLKTMNVNVEMPITIYVDNVGQYGCQTTEQPVKEQNTYIQDQFL